MNINNNPENALNYLLSLDESELFKEFVLSGEALESYRRLMRDFENSNSNNRASTREKGETLENLVLFIAQKTNLFEEYPNLRTSSNEIDLLLKSKSQSMLLLESFVSTDFNNIIIECKNHDKKIGVTWIGKIYSLLRYQRSKFGIIFSYHGFSGKDWSDGVGLSKKIHLLDETKIIDFNIENFKEMEEGIDFLTIIKRKLINLQNDVLIESSSHPAESYLNDIDKS